MSEYVDNQLFILSKTADNIIQYLSKCELDRKLAAAYSQDLLTTISKLHQLRGTILVGKLK